MTSSAKQDAVFSTDSPALVPAVHVDARILLVRGQKVLIDRDLAELYGVETRILNRAVQRNLERFPEDFMFRLTRAEIARISQIGTSSEALKFSKNVNAYTEQGIAMLSGLLNSPRAVAVNIEIMRTFVRLRQMIAGNADLARKLKAMEKKYDEQFKVVFDAIRELMTPPTADEIREMGFHTILKTTPPAKSKG